MSKSSDQRFTFLLAAPDAYQARRKGVGRALVRGDSFERAAAACHLSPDELAGAFGVLKQARRAAARAGRVAAKGGRLAVRVHPLAIAATGTKLVGKGLAAATGPIRRRIFRAFFGKLVNRRARLLSWTNRKTLQPSPAEREAARRWAISYVKRRGIFGKLVGAALSGDAIGEAATTALVTASVPVLLELARRALRTAEKDGAPADPRTAGDGEAAAEE